MSLMNKARQAAVRFWRDNGGASGIEYAIIATMVAVAIASFSTPISTAIKNIFTSIQNAI